MRVSVSPGSPPVATIRGEIDIQSAPGLCEELLRVIRHRGPQLTIDLAGVTFMDRAGINVLMATRRRARLEGGWVRVVRVPPRVRRMFSLLSLERAFGLSAPAIPCETTGRHCPPNGADGATSSAGWGLGLTREGHTLR